MRSRASSLRGACVLIAAITAAGCLPAADAPIPAGYDDLVDSARRSLLSNVEGLIRPSLAFTGIRCFANSGLIVVFRQVGGRSPGEPAFAMGGPDSAGNPGGWSGGFGQEGMEEEIEFNYGDVPEIACPPLPA